MTCMSLRTRFYHIEKKILQENMMRMNYKLYILYILYVSYNFKYLNDKIFLISESSGVPHTVYKGNHKKYTKECLIIFDKETGAITLEKLNHNIQVKKTR